MNQDFQREWDMIFDRAVLKSYNKISYWQGTIHLFRWYCLHNFEFYRKYNEKRNHQAHLRYRKAIENKSVVVQSPVPQYLRTIHMHSLNFVWSVRNKTLHKIVNYIYNLIFWKIIGIGRTQEGIIFWKKR